MAEDNRNETLRFKTLASRLSTIQVNAARSLRHAGVLDPKNRDESWLEDPLDDLGGNNDHFSPEASAAAQASAVLANRSLFAQELGRCVTSFRERRFGLLYFDLKQRVESLPELLHHLPYVVAALVAGLHEVATCTPGTPAHLSGAPRPTPPVGVEPLGNAERAAQPLLQLIAVLATECQTELWPEHAHSLIGAVCGVVSGDAPELCGHAFRCLSYVLKGLATPLSEDPGQLRRYYGPLLGHGRDFVRRFAAETFAPVVRRLKPKALQRHLRQVLKALLHATAAASPSAAAVEDGAPNVPLAEVVERLCGRAVADNRAVVDGVAQLYFEVAKGTGSGELHSRASDVFNCLLANIVDPPVSASSSSSATSSTASEGAAARFSPLASAVAGAVGQALAAKLCAHLRPVGAGPFWEALLPALARAARRLSAALPRWSAAAASKPTPVSGSSSSSGSSRNSSTKGRAGRRQSDGSGDVIDDASKSTTQATDAAHEVACSAAACAHLARLCALLLQHRDALLLRAAPEAARTARALVPPLAALATSNNLLSCLGPAQRQPLLDVVACLGRLALGPPTGGAQNALLSASTVDDKKGGSGAKSSSEGQHSFVDMLPTILAGLLSTPESTHPAVMHALATPPWAALTTKAQGQALSIDNNWSSSSVTDGFAFRSMAVQTLATTLLPALHSDATNNQRGPQSATVKRSVVRSVLSAAAACANADLATGAAIALQVVVHTAAHCQFRVTEDAKSSYSGARDEKDSDDDENDDEDEELDHASSYDEDSEDGDDGGKKSRLVVGIPLALLQELETICESAAAAGLERLPHLAAAAAILQKSSSSSHGQVPGGDAGAADVALLAAALRCAPLLAAADRTWSPAFVRSTLTMLDSSEISSDAVSIDDSVNEASATALVIRALAVQTLAISLATEEDSAADERKSEEESDASVLLIELTCRSLGWLRTTPGSLATLQATNQCLVAVRKAAARGAGASGATTDSFPALAVSSDGGRLVRAAPAPATVAAAASAMSGRQTPKKKAKGSSKSSASVDQATAPTSATFPLRSWNDLLASDGRPAAAALCQIDTGRSDKASNITKTKASGGGPGKEEADDLVAQMLPNLHHENHRLRRATLRFLTLLEDGAGQPPVRSKHGSARGAGDQNMVDDEGASAAAAEGAGAALKLCLELERLPLTLAREREHTLKLTNLAVLASNGLLGSDNNSSSSSSSSSGGDGSSSATPASDTRAAAMAASHCLGLLQRKFQPLWEPASTTFAALALARPDVAWPPLLALLTTVCRRHRPDTAATIVGADAVATSTLEVEKEIAKQPASGTVGAAVKAGAAAVEQAPQVRATAALQCELSMLAQSERGGDGGELPEDGTAPLADETCVAFGARTELTMAPIEENSSNSSNKARSDAVSTAAAAAADASSSATDLETLFGLVLRCAGGAPELVRRWGSRAVVALFLEFMAVDFFGCFYDDPDHRELGLIEHLEDFALAEVKQATVEAGGGGDDDDDGDESSRTQPSSSVRQQKQQQGLLLEQWSPAVAGAPSPNALRTQCTMERAVTAANSHASGEANSNDGVVRPFSLLRPAEVWRRLSSWLSLWDCIGAPKSLAKHQVLLQVFVRLLAKPKAGIASAALACVRAYKLPYLQPYDAQLRALVANEGSATSTVSGNSHGASSSSGNGVVKAHLRDSLVLFSLHAQGGDVAPPHRAGLVPVLARIVYGRLIARGGRTATAKDTPAARRAAILAFVSHLDGETELQPFIFLMVRSFVPAHVPLATGLPLPLLGGGNSGNKSGKSSHSSSSGEQDPVVEEAAVVARALAALENLSAADLVLEGGAPAPANTAAAAGEAEFRASGPTAVVSLSRQVGFLTLLRALVAKLGHTCVPFLPHFMRVLLAVLHNSSEAAAAQDAAVAAAAASAAIASVNDDDEEDDDDNDDDDDNFDEVAAVDAPMKSKHDHARDQVLTPAQARERAAATAAAKVRGQCLRAMTALLAQFGESGVHVFTRYAEQLWPALLPALNRLPRAGVLAGRQAKPPALAIFLHALSAHPKHLPLLAAAPDVPLSVPQVSPGPSSSSIVAPTAPTNTTTTMVSSAHGSAALMALIACLSAGADTGAGREADVSAGDRFALNGASSKSSSGGSSGSGRPFGAGLKAVKGCGAPVLELVFGCLEHLLASPAGRQLLRPLLPAAVAHLAVRGSKGLTGGTHRIEAREVVLLCNLADFAVDGSADEDALPPPSSSKSKKGVHKEVRAEAKVHDDDEDNEEDALGGGGGDGWGGRSAAAQRAKAWAATVDPQTSQQLATLLLGLLTKRFQALHHSDRNGSSSGGGGLSGGFESIGGGSGATFTGVASHLPPADRLKLHALRVLAALVPALPNPNRVILFLAKLLGPSPGAGSDKSRSSSSGGGGFGSELALRTGAIRLLRVCARHPTLQGKLGPAVHVVRSLGATTLAAVKGTTLKAEERDYARCVPAYAALASSLTKKKQALGDDDDDAGDGASNFGSRANKLMARVGGVVATDIDSDEAKGVAWEELFRAEEEHERAQATASVLPEAGARSSSGAMTYMGVSLVIAQCLHGLYDEEVAIRAAAVAALRALVQVLAQGPAKLPAEPAATPAAAAAAAEKTPRSSKKSSKKNIAAEEGAVPSSATPSKRTAAHTSANLAALREARFSALRTFLLPGLKAGLRSPNDAARKGMLAVIAELVRQFHAHEHGSSTSPVVSINSSKLAGSSSSTMSASSVAAFEVPFVDLQSLLHDEDPEMDFFLNVCHVQVHRRARAFKRLANLLDQKVVVAPAAAAAMETTDSRGTGRGTGKGKAADNISSSSSAAEDIQPYAWAISPSSIAHVLLPLAMHPLHESGISGTKAVAADVLLPDALQAITSLCKRLPWGKYAATLRLLVGQLERHVKAEAKLRGNGGVVMEVSEGLSSSNSGSGGSSGQHERDLKERALASGVCAVLDGFHFEVSEADVAAVRTSSLSSWKVKAKSADSKPGQSKDSEGQEVDDENKMNVDSEGTAAAEGGSQDDKVDEEEEKVGDEDEKDDDEEEGKEDDEVDNDDAEEEDASNKVWAALEDKFLPQLQKLVLKQKVGRRGEKQVGLRSNVATAVLKLVLRLPPQARNKQLPQLVGTVTNELRSKHQDARDGARSAMANMARDLGPLHLPLLLSSLRARLTHGYMLHVRAAALHAMLLSLTKKYSAPGQGTAAAITAAPPATTTAAAAVAVVASSSTTNSSSHKGGSRSEDDDGRYPVLPLPELARLADLRASLKHPSIAERAQASRHEWSAAAFEAAGSKGRGGKGKGGKGKGKGKGKGGKGTEEEVAADPFKDGRGSGLYAGLEKPGVPLSAVLPPLDACTDKIMRLCLEDLFGEAAESKEAQDVLKNEVKEAKGAKTYDVIEMLAKAVLFRPSYVLLANSSVDLGGALDASAVHALVTPLVARLNRPQHLHASAKDAAKATAALERVASGLAANPSVDPRELLLYVYSTCAPFVKSRFGGRRTATGSSASVDEATPGGGENGGSSNDEEEDSSESEEEEEGNDDDEDDEEKLEWTAKRMNVAPKTPNASKSDLKAAGAAATAGAAVATPSLSKSARKRQSEARRAQRQLSGTTWLPSMNAGDRLREGGGGVKSMVGHTAALALSGALPTSMPSKANGNNSGGGSGGGAATAVAGLRSPVSKKARKYASVQVLDGAQAPKLTGRDRLTSHHRPGEMPGQDGGPQVKGMVVNDDDDDEGGGNGSGSNGISQLNEAAAHGTVHFALSVFYAHLRKGCLSPHALGVGESGSGSGGSGGGSGFGFAKASPEVLRDVLAMAEPFLPLLNHCARAAVSDDRVRLLALKCLGLLLKWPLSGISKYARRLGKGLLKLLTWASGSGSGEGSGSSSAGVVASRSELVQGCFKGLTTLLYFDPTEAYAAGGSALGLTKSEGGDSSANFAVTADLAAAAAACLQQQQQQLALTDGSSDGTAARAKSQQQHKGPKVALSAAQMKALVRVLHHSLLDASHQSSSFQLVRALVHQRVVVSEMYDLMDRMASANVTASRLPVRQQAGHIFVRFLLFYPMGPKRLDHHIKQALGNLQYVHASGRLSGIELVAGLCSHLPTPVLDEHAQLLMLPLVLRVANDPDPVCRKACLAAIRTLLGRCSAAAFAQLWELVAGWLNAGQKETGGGEARDGDGLDKEVKGAKRRHEGSDGDSWSETEEVTGGAAAAATDAGAGVSSPSSSSSSPVLEATAAQVAGACIEARPDLMKRNGRATALVLGLRSCLRKHLAREQKLLARDADTAARAKARAQSQTSKAAAAAVASRDDDDEEDGGWQSAELAWSNTHSNSESGEGSDDDDEEEDLSDDGDDNDQEGASGYLPPWTVCYHALLCLERCTKALPSSSDAAARSFQSQPSAQFARATAARVLAIQAGTEEAEVERGYGPQPATEPVDNEEAGWFWSVVAEALVMGHPWVRLAAARVLGLYFSRRSPQRLVLSSGDSNNKSTGGSTGAGGGGDNDGSGGEYLASPGTLFRLARLTLTQLDEPDGANGARGEFLAPPLAEQAVKNLVFLANAMRHHPHLCNKAAVSLAAGRSGDESKRHRQGAAAAAAENDDDNDDEEDDDEDDNASEGENSDEEETAERSSAAQPATAATLATAGSGGANGSDAFGYLMRRTNLMSRRRGDDRRAAIFQWFGAFAATQPLAVVQQHLTTMVDALYRAKVDGQSAAAAAGGGGGGYGKASSEAWSQDSHRGGGAAAEGGIAAAGGDASGGGGGGVAESTLAVPLLIDEVFELLEDKVGASTLLAARAEVQQRFDAKRDRRKRARAAAAVTDPESYAAQKLARNRQKKDGEKRRKRAFGEMRKAGGSRGKGKGKGKGKGGGHSMGNSGPGLQHLGGGFGRKRPKG